MERVWQREYANQAEATRDIADYTVNFYNPYPPRSPYALSFLLDHDV